MNWNVPNVPNLRFPGFEGEWNTRSLGEITSWASGGTPAKDNSSYWNGDIPWISASSMRGISYADSELKITEAGLKKGSRLAAKGNLLILVRGSMLFNKIPIGIALRNVAFNQDVKSIVVSNESSSDFVLNWFTASESKLLNMVTGTGIGAGKLDLQELKDLKIKLPSLLEQQKISSFFSLLNQRIETQSKIIEGLETLIKNLREKLFKQKLRFKNIEKKNFLDWEIKKLYEVGTFFSGGTPLTSKREYFNGKIPFIRSGEINSSKTEQYISEEGLRNSSAKMVEVGDLIYALYGATSGEVGISKIKGAINQAILCIRTSLEPLYLFNYLKSQKENIIKTYLQGGQGNLSAEIIRTLKIPIPQLEEQFVLANFLSSLDKKIQTEKQILERLENQKKYLLQQLFT